MTGKCASALLSQPRDVHWSSFGDPPPTSGGRLCSSSLERRAADIGLRETQLLSKRNLRQVVVEVPLSFICEANSLECRGSD